MSWEEEEAWYGSDSSGERGVRIRTTWTGLSMVGMRRRRRRRNGGREVVAPVQHPPTPGIGRWRRDNRRENDQRWLCSQVPQLVLSKEPSPTRSSVSPVAHPPLLLLTPRYSPQDRESVRAPCRRQGQSHPSSNSDHGLMVLSEEASRVDCHHKDDLCTPWDHGILLWSRSTRSW